MPGMRGISHLLQFLNQSAGVPSVRSSPGALWGFSFRFQRRRRSSSSTFLCHCERKRYLDLVW